jgi:hypothetical protein
LASPFETLAPTLPPLTIARDGEADRHDIGSLDGTPPMGHTQSQRSLPGIFMIEDAAEPIEIAAPVTDGDQAGAKFFQIGMRRQRFAFGAAGFRSRDELTEVLISARILDHNSNR